MFYGHTTPSETPAEGKEPSIVRVRDIYPPLERAAEEIPEKAKRFLQQALESLHAPDGSLMLAASSIDAMLKDKGLKQGSLYSRIDQAAKEGVLTQQMRDWAHEIRLSANEPRHADEDSDGATHEDARQIVQFAKALAEYLYVLPSRVAKWQRPEESQDDV